MCISARSQCSGALIVNADDWGRDRETTDKTLDCALGGTISSASAMVFMSDSERAADLAQEHAIDVGLHLNFTTLFSAPGVPARLHNAQSDIGGCLRQSRFAQAVFHPTLVRAFEYVVAAQLEEFARLYGSGPKRIDGHHHMHLCANVVFGRLLPAGTVVRRNFSFQRGEKSLLNRLYRKAIDRQLARRHRLADFLFSLPPLEPVERLQGIFSLAREHAVELETHPVEPAEYRFLSKGEILRVTGDVPIARGFTVSDPDVCLVA